jgi:FKBP-type peptidyl-prolyl cis-trans isomerase FklB
MKKLSVLAMAVSLFLGLSAVQAHAESAAETNLKTGETFMQENAENSKVVTLPSGLQYEVLEEGTGEKPTQTDTVTVDYEGKLVNGNVFDSSYARGEPISFPVGGVIQGWQEALKLMNAGSTWMLYIPPSLAYGEHGAGGMIGPNETLIFKVHLISVDR